MSQVTFEVSRGWAIQPKVICRWNVWFQRFDNLIYSLRFQHCRTTEKGQFPQNLEKKGEPQRKKERGQLKLFVTAMFPTLWVWVLEDARANALKQPQPHAGQTQQGPHTGSCVVASCSAEGTREPAGAAVSFGATLTSWTSTNASAPCPRRTLSESTDPAVNLVPHKMNRKEISLKETCQNRQRTF